MTEREKEVLYQNKRRLYLNSFSSHGENERRLVSPSIAQEILERFHGSDPENARELVLTGTEFRDRPPTKSGEEAYINGIVHVLLWREYFRQEKPLPGAIPGEQELLNGLLGDFHKLLDQTCHVWFQAAGVRESDGSELEREERKKAMEKLLETIEAYESGVREIRRRKAIEFAELYLKDCERKAEKEVPEDRIVNLNMEALIKEHDAVSKEDEGRLEQIRGMSRRLRQKLIENRRRIKWGSKALLAMEEDPKTTPERRSLIQWVRGEYETEGRDREQAILAEDNGLLSIVRCILTGNQTDPVTADVARRCFGYELPCLPLDMRLKELPGYLEVGSVDTMDSDREFHTMEEFREGAKELAQYRHNHRQQFEHQTVLSICEGLEELPHLAARSRSLRTWVSKAYSSGFAKNLDPKEKKELLEIWITSEATTKVAFFVLEYIRNNASKTLADLKDTMLYEFAEMNYAEQRNLNRAILTRIFQGGEDVPQ